MAEEEESDEGGVSISVTPMAMILFSHPAIIIPAISSILNPFAGVFFPHISLRADSDHNVVNCFAARLGA